MLLVASATLLPGCSNDEEAMPSSSTGPAPTYIPGDSEVEIGLGTSLTDLSVSVDKRAAETGEYVQAQLGVFCLAMNKQTDSGEIPDIKWFADASEDDKACPWTKFKNLSATSAESSGELTFSTTNYYPATQYYAYGFFAYAPYATTNTEVVPSAEVSSLNRWRVKYTIDGTQDILWGRSTDDEEDRTDYSAQYFRQTANVGKTPQIEMKHVLTRLTFRAKTLSATVGGGEPFPGAEKTYVRVVQISDVPTQLYLTVADQGRMNTLDETNCLEPVPDVANKDLVLRDEDGDFIYENPIKINPDLNGTVDLGESIMLMPASSYKLRIQVMTLKTPVPEGGEVSLSNAVLSETAATLRISSNEATFQAGKSYTVTINIAGTKQTTATANLQLWDTDVTNPDDVGFNTSDNTSN